MDQKVYTTDKITVLQTNNLKYTNVFGFSTGPLCNQVPDSI